MTITISTFVQTHVGMVRLNHLDGWLHDELPAWSCLPILLLTAQNRVTLLIKFH